MVDYKTVYEIYKQQAFEIAKMGWKEETYSHILKVTDEMNPVEATLLSRLIDITSEVLSGEMSKEQARIKGNKAFEEFKIEVIKEVSNG